MDCLLADSHPAGYVPAAAVSVPTSTHAVASYPDFFPPPLVLSSQMIKDAPPLIAQGLHCIHFFRQERIKTYSTNLSPNQFGVSLSFLLRFKLNL